MHGARVNIFVKDNIFIRPQFDLHYVPTSISSAQWREEESLGGGYRWGGQKLCGSFFSDI